MLAQLTRCSVRYDTYHQRPGEISLQAYLIVTTYLRHVTLWLFGSGKITITVFFSVFSDLTKVIELFRATL